MNTIPSEPDDGPDHELLDQEQLDDHRLDRELDEDAGDLGASLRALLDPPGDIRNRTTDVVGRSLSGGSVFAVATDLLGLGWRTARTILSDDPAPADGSSEGTEP
ncbi:MAG: hypothetical protein ACOYOP_05740 [Microthrixaceae bacterium]